ncbi:uncharacterized protein KY384_003156 [Bacidia gigantensis]|uniref:uncharacterized protein n=1 Tax=Bacidia gigantensis TaxID=2732470 RepID=UPI001D05A0CB|nr:uncharacterized protein KY384_003156 [Bacidia gigantensis]KAG8531527.1 hypothetical protein KY384_003156 [Bacidia gigantensis]
MPKVKPISLSAMVDTDGEEDARDTAALPTPDSNQENPGSGRKKGGRQKANAKRFTKPKRLSGDSMTSKATGLTKPKAGRRRAPLKDTFNDQKIDETEEVDEFAQSDADMTADPIQERSPVLKRKAATTKVGRPAKVRVTKQVGAVAKDGEFEYTPTVQRQTKRAAKDTIGDPDHRIQHDPHGSTEFRHPGEEVIHNGELTPQALSRRSNNAQGAPRQRKIAPTRRRAGSASETDRTVGDPTLRRRLGEMTRKFENLDLKYRNLREVGLKEAEINYDKLRKQSEVNAQAANDLIASMKKEIAMQKAIVKESQSFQSQVQIREADLTQTRALADQLSKSLAEAQNENKALQAKLTTLHFKLAVAKDTDDTYEDTEFQYMPRLDENRDRDLIRLLPEYLTEDITFSRMNAAMFYGRVGETLTKRRSTEVPDRPV